jgi:hypothetical protein
VGQPHFSVKKVAMTRIIQKAARSRHPIPLKNKSLILSFDSVGLTYVRTADIFALWNASLIASRHSKASAHVFCDSSGAIFFRISGQTCRACSHTDLSRIP